MTNAQIPASIAERYVSAVEREANRTACYERLAAAQLARGLAKRALADAEYAVRVAQETLDDMSEDEEGDR